MKKTLSIILSVLFFTPTSFAQDIISLGEMSQAINTHLAQAHQYLTTSLSNRQHDKLLQQLISNEDRIMQSLEFHFKHNRDYLMYIARWHSGPISSQYITKVFQQLEAGSLHKTTAEILLDLPEFRQQTMEIVLNYSSQDMDRLIRRVQKALLVPHDRAASLVMAAEIEYADKMFSGRISALRNQMVRSKWWLRRRCDRHTYNMTHQYKQKIKDAGSEILHLLNERQHLRKDFTYAFGLQDANEIFRALADTPLPKLMSKQAAIFERFAKRLHSVLPVAVGIGIFTTIFTTQANANERQNAQILEEMSQSLHEHISLKQDILYGLRQNPEYIGLFYAGGEKSREILLQLFENQGPNSLQTEVLLPYAAEWQDKMYSLLNDDDSFADYVAVLKEIHTSALEQELTNNMEKYFQMPADRTRVSIPSFLATQY